MKIKIWKYEFSLKRADQNSLAAQGQTALRNRSLTSIYRALDEIENKGLKYSEYRVQKLSGLSLNTVKKYRPEIEAYRAKNNRSLLPL